MSSPRGRASKATARGASSPGAGETRQAFEQRRDGIKFELERGH